VYNKIVDETVLFLNRRFQEYAINFNDISQTNFNPFLLLITSPVYNTFSPFEVSERLQLGKAFHGDDTAFGRYIEEKILPLFGSKVPPEKRAPATKDLWSSIDAEITIEGYRYLFTYKSGPWTMNQSHANEMTDKFRKIHDASGCNIIIGIFYGTYPNLNNKPALVGSNLGNPDWFDYLVGRDFWEFSTGVRDIHKLLFKAIRDAQKKFADAHQDETFQELLIGNRIKIAASLRKAFIVGEDEDFWQTLFNNAF
jgi:hypothetical protein